MVRLWDGATCKTCGAPVDAFAGHRCTGLGGRMSMEAPAGPEGGLWQCDHCGGWLMHGQSHRCASARQAGDMIAVRHRGALVGTAQRVELVDGKLHVVGMMVLTVDLRRTADVRDGTVYAFDFTVYRAGKVAAHHGGMLYAAGDVDVTAEAFWLVSGVFRSGPPLPLPYGWTLSA